MGLDLTTVIQSMPYVQNVAQAELVNPAAQQAATQLLAQEFLAKQQSQTPPVEKQESMSTVQDDRQQRHGTGGQPQHRAKRPPAEPEDTQTGNATPFAGHIIDMKI